MGRQPLYQTIVADIQNSIATGALRPGQKLPSITELSAQYDCSETVVKTALTVLRTTGAVEGHQGKGVFVAG
ncbi:MAG TPA: winged helix-turn-helix domain-containing protein [Mycobacterium sp.]|nr:winged helix-turn-helix domain-containing protein [Mycobacterium sp.]